MLFIQFNGDGWIYRKQRRTLNKRWTTILCCCCYNIVLTKLFHTNNGNSTVSLEYSNKCTQFSYSYSCSMEYGVWGSWYTWLCVCHFVYAHKYVDCVVIHLSNGCCTRSHHCFPIRIIILTQSALTALSLGWAVWDRNHVSYSGMMEFEHFGEVDVWFYCCLDMLNGNDIFSPFIDMDWMLNFFFLISKEILRIPWFQNEQPPCPPPPLSHW